jgi:hypothetical protein
MKIRKGTKKSGWTYLSKMSRYKKTKGKTVRQVKDRKKWYTIKYP